MRRFVDEADRPAARSQVSAFLQFNDLPDRQALLDCVSRFATVARHADGEFPRGEPIDRLAVVARETFATRENSHFYYLALGLQASLLVFMVSSFFLSVAYGWNVYYLVGYAVCFRRMYESETGKSVVIEKRKHQLNRTKDETTIGESAHRPAIA